jgi:hypothetical protein
MHQPSWDLLTVVLLMWHVYFHDPLVLLLLLLPLQNFQENGPAVLTTVLNTQHVPQQLDSFESAAAADRALAEGIVGGQHAQQVLGQLHKMEAAISAAAAAAAAAEPESRHGTARSTAAAAAAADRGSSAGGRKRVRFEAAAGGDDSADADSDADPAADSDADEDQDDVVMTDAAAGSSKQRQATKQQLQRAERTFTAAVASWAVNSSFLPHQQQQQQRRQREGSAGIGGGAVPAAGATAAAQAATYQFLDCLPERRVLWRLLFKGSLGPVPLNDVQQQQQHGQQQQHSQQQVQQHGGPMGVSSALGSLVSVYAATAFSSGPAAAAGGALDAAVLLSGLQSYQAGVCISKSAALLRQCSRQIHKKQEAYIRIVSAAVASADAEAAAVAAAAADAAAEAAAAAAEGGAAAAEAAEAAQAAAAAAGSHVNLPRVLQALPSAAVAAAAEAARLRIDLCR